MTTDITDSVSSSLDIPKKGSHLQPRYFYCDRILSKEEITLDALWHQSCPVHCSPTKCEWPQAISPSGSALQARLSQSPPRPFLSMLQPQRHAQDNNLPLIQHPPLFTLSIVLCPLGPPGSLIVSQATCVSLISIWLSIGLWGYCIPEPTAGHGRDSCREECNWFRAAPKAWSWRSKLFRIF